MAGEVWFQALMLQPPRICGKQLKPFAIVHEYTLKQIGNPYVAGGECSPIHLMEGLDICSKTWEEIRSDIYSPSKLRTALWCIRWRRHGLGTASDSFVQYIMDGIATPDLWEKVAAEGAEEGAVMGAPWEYHLVRCLMSDFGMTESQAWNFPVGRARCLYDCIEEWRGNVKVVSEYQQQLIEQAKT